MRDIPEFAAEPPWEDMLEVLGREGVSTDEALLRELSAGDGGTGWGVGCLLARLFGPARSAR